MGVSCDEHADKHGFERAYLMCNLACRPTDSINISADYAIHEQIVILLPSCKVLSKEERSRLNE